MDNIANDIRKKIITTVYENKTGHLGGPLSSVEILTALYFDIMNINPVDQYNENRDRFVLSKGHASIALYATLTARGYLKNDELKSFGKINSRLQNHPDMNLMPEVDFSTGSLGQGISGAAGIALGAKLQNKSFYTYCLIGDGESQEGQVWEALDFISRNKLNNLITIVDNNKLQQYGWGSGDKRENPIINLNKFASFGLSAQIVDGHNISDIINTINYAKTSERPTIIIANTIKGKGVSFMENNYLYHSIQLNESEYNLAMKELEEV